MRGYLLHLLEGSLSISLLGIVFEPSGQLLAVHRAVLFGQHLKHQSSRVGIRMDGSFIPKELGVRKNVLLGHIRNQLRFSMIRFWQASVHSFASCRLPAGSFFSFFSSSVQARLASGDGAANLASVRSSNFKALVSACFSMLSSPPLQQQTLKLNSFHGKCGKNSFQHRTIAAARPTQPL